MSYLRQCSFFMLFISKETVTDDNTFSIGLGIKLMKNNREQRETAFLKEQPSTPMKRNTAYDCEKGYCIS